MRRLRKVIFCLGTASTGFGLGSLYGAQAEGAQHPRIRKVHIRAKRTPSQASVEKVSAQREQIHKRMLNGEYQHDGSLELLGIGDIPSVPALLRVLKDNPPTIMPDGSLSGICTIAHAYAALVKITGTKHRTYEEWNEWWEQYQKEHPQKSSHGRTKPRT